MHRVMISDKALASWSGPGRIKIGRSGRKKSGVGWPCRSGDKVDMKIACEHPPRASTTEEALNTRRQNDSAG